MPYLYLAREARAVRASSPARPGDTMPPTLYPCLRYVDAPAAITWLERAFGFTTHARHDAPDGRVAHAELRLGHGLLMVGSGESAPTREPDPARAWSGLYVVIDDLEAHCERARAAGATITQEPRDTDYGSREYAALDLEGKVWSFGTYQPWTA
jgi:uncharacterized glyoxalase superfamily protein PhnB